MTPRSDPHTEAIRQALELEHTRLLRGGYGCRHITDALAALAALESERDEARDALAFAKVGHHDVADMLVAAEARVAKLEKALARMRELAPDRWKDAGVQAALGVVADGGGGRDGE